ncbi:31406_t:CDS:1, partial [Racocetra persica]
KMKQISYKYIGLPKPSEDSISPSNKIYELANKENPIIRELSGTLKELDTFMINHDVKNAGRKILSQARNELNELSKKIDQLKAENQDLLKKKLDEQNEKFNQMMANYENSMEEHIKDKEIALMKQFDQEKHDLYQQHHEQLNSELSHQASKYKEELENELVRQAVDMQRRW